VRLELALALTLRQRTELHVDVTTGHTRILIDVAHGEQIGLDLLGKLVAKLLMRHLTTTKLELDAHLVTFGKKVFGMRDLDQVVMRVDADAEFHFLHLAALLVLVSFLLVLLLIVLVLAVVDDLAHGWIGIGSDLDKIESAVFGHAYGLSSRNDAKLVIPVIIDDTHLRRTDALIDAGLIHKTTVRAVTAVAIAAWAKRTAAAGSLITTGWPCCRRACWAWRTQRRGGWAGC
jgi:hypothetical protein